MDAGACDRLDDILRQSEVVMPNTPNPPPAYVSLIGLKYEDVVLLLRALDALVGEADDVETLTAVDALQKKIKGSIDAKSQVFGM